MKKTVTQHNVTEEWSLYSDGVDYKRQIGLFRTVDENHRYYLGDQWRGVKSNGLPTPVYNIIKPVIRYKVATIMATDTKILYTVLNDRDKRYNEMAATADLLTKHAENLWEQKSWIS